MLFSRRIIVPLLIAAVSPLLGRSQGPMALPAVPPESPRAYDNSSDGLRWQLQDILNVAREHNGSKLESLIKQMEIPDYENWFTKIYGSEIGERMAGAYGRNLANSESDLEATFNQLAIEDGEFTLHKAGDAQRLGVNAPAIMGRQDPADPYMASWQIRGPSAAIEVHPVGFFIYLEGSFRWVRTFRRLAIHPMKASEPDVSQGVPPEQTAEVPDSSSTGGKDQGAYHTGTGGVGYPICTYCPSPEYTKEARKKHLEGTVVLQVIVQPDGHASDIQIVKAFDAGLGQSAVEAVSKWRFDPARRADGEAVPVRVPIEVTFRILK